MKHGLSVSFGLAMLMAIPAVAAAPGDVTGTWTVDADVQGVSVAETCVLAQAADGKLTGTCDVNGMAKYDTTGSVKDSDIVFQHAGEYEGTKLTMTYTGKIGADGVVTGVLDVDPMAVSGSFTAKKSAASATPPAAK